MNFGSAGNIIVLLALATQACHSTLQDNPAFVFDGKTAMLSLANYEKSDETGQAFSQLIILDKNSTVTIEIVEIPPGVSFFITQIHTHLYNVTLSYDETIIARRYTSGSNIGLVINVNEQNAPKIYVQNDNRANVEALLAVVAYPDNAPVPGGCNMEFDTEIAPYHKLTVTDSTVKVDIQPGASPKSKGIPVPCEANAVQHEMYRLFLPEQDFTSSTYFSSIVDVLTVQGIRANSRKIPSSATGSKMRRVYSAYPGTGSVYAALAITGNNTAAYVPAFTYACSPSNWMDTCQVLRNIGISVFLGCILGLTWLGFWWLYAIPVFAILLATTTLGFFWSSIAYFSSPAGVGYLENDTNFWLIFILLIFFVPLALSVVPDSANIICCAILGSYSVVISIDHYVGSNLKYIIINIVRRATSPGFNVAVIHPPYQSKDICLTVFWIILAVAGIIFQLRLNRGRPPFPPGMSVPGTRNLPQSERTPLLVESRMPISASRSDDHIFESPKWYNRFFPCFKLY
ncbi:transmembrane 7 superfamily member 3-like isoform X2 [Athalia rosae]|uniref:transmembrane 7 superfamily member 3-like isoform X2 n=1 Tax=Athalia rosae TaxID=37344 RepID=UPI0020339A62|nr:transmembrane 7 superfamily member 3-like isoform X2 [Athalia rosae]